MKFYVLGLVSGIIISCGVGSFADEIGVTASNGFLQCTKMVCSIWADGKEIDLQGTPILNYEGKSYLPVRKLAEITGADVNWDGDNKVINVKAILKETVAKNPDNLILTKTKDGLYKASNINTDGNGTTYTFSSTGNVYESFSNGKVIETKLFFKTLDDNFKERNTLKTYAYIANCYDVLDDLSRNIYNISNRLSTSYWGISTLNKEDLDKDNEYINYQIQRKNKLSENLNYIVELAKKENLDVSDMNTIFSELYDSLEYYKKSFNSLSDFYYSKNNTNFKNYLDNCTLGHNKALNASQIAFNSHDKIYNLLQNFK